MSDLPQDMAASMWQAQLAALLPERDELEPPLLLVADDEPQILRSVARLVRGLDVRLMTAENGMEALEILQRERVAVLLSDQIMPGITGAELLQRAEQLSPHTVRVMVTGNNDILTAVEAVNRGEVFRFVTKPWQNQTFLKIIEASLTQHRVLVAHARYQDLLETQNEHLVGLNALLDERVRERTRQLAESHEQVQRLYRELEDSFDETLRSLLTVMELGDISIADHCRRTASRAAAFAAYLGLTGADARAIERAALLHWIGLISAPPAMLRKPSAQLNEEEWAAWEFHPILGHQTLSRIPALERSALIILNYQRLYEDETFCVGASAGVLDEKIDAALLLSAKILGLCSAFERHRTTHHGLARDLRRLYLESLELLNAESGTRFDPTLLHSFREFIATQRAAEQATRSERQIDIEALEVGMKLARVLSTHQGIPVAPRDQVIDEALLKRLKRFARTTGLEAIYVWE